MGISLTKPRFQGLCWFVSGTPINRLKSTHDEPNQLWTNAFFRPERPDSLPEKSSVKKNQSGAGFQYEARKHHMNSYKYIITKRISLWVFPSMVVTPQTAQKLIIFSRKTPMEVVGETQHFGRKSTYYIIDLSRSELTTLKKYLGIFLLSFLPVTLNDQGWFWGRIPLLYQVTSAEVAIFALIPKPE